MIQIQNKFKIFLAQKKLQFSLRKQVFMQFILSEYFAIKFFFYFVFFFFGRFFVLFYNDYRACNLFEFFLIYLKENYFLTVLKNLKRPLSYFFSLDDFFMQILWLGLGFYFFLLIFFLFCSSIEIIKKSIKEKMIFLCFILKKIIFSFIDFLIILSKMSFKKIFYTCFDFVFTVDFIYFIAGPIWFFILYIIDNYR